MSGKKCISTKNTTCLKYISALFAILVSWNIISTRTKFLYDSMTYGGHVSPGAPLGWQFHTKFPVDVVYTWVNGSDPKFKLSVQILKRKLKRNKLLSASSSSNLAKNRFADSDALLFSLRSLEKYANWIRHVFIVTNGQRPNWLNLSNPRVSIIKHEDIFDEPAYLPTFSSHAIEHNIHKIQGLSEKFIYLNDDFFFGSDVTLEDFYTEERGTKVYLAWNAPNACSGKCHAGLIQNGVCDHVCNYDHCSWDGGDCDNIPAKSRPRDTDTAHVSFMISTFYTNALYNRAFGVRRRKVIAHAPLFMEVKVKNDLDARFPNEVNKTIHRQLRSPLDIQFEFSYMHFLMEAYDGSVRFETKVSSPDVVFAQIATNLKKTKHMMDLLQRSDKYYEYKCL